MRRKTYAKIRGQVPRKQGLKQYATGDRHIPPANPRASSKKTRIETNTKNRHRQRVWNPRASSKKTRIETYHLFGDKGIAANIRGQVPRKQGLKRKNLSEKQIRRYHPRASSKKTRIETEPGRNLWRREGAIRGQVPRKQGLKQRRRKTKMYKCENPRASSKKTRIETQKPFGETNPSVSSEGKFQENKD